jgi:hypothetical protein
MKHFLVFLFLISSSILLKAQSTLSIGTGPSVTGGSTFGIMRSNTTANSWNRNAYIYPQSLFTTIATNSTINSLEFESSNFSGATLAADAAFKIYIKNTTSADFGTSSLTWATEIATATLVYNGTPSSIVGTNSGFKKFTFSSGFVYTGNSIEILVEYKQTTAPASEIYWAYDDETSVPAYTTNQGKYINGTGSFAATLTNSNSRHPNMKVNYTPANPVPINLISFYGEYKNNAANLFWQLASNTSLQKFELEKSFNNNTWMNINTIGKNTVSNNYTYTDALLNIGKCYYRLKMFDKDGTVTYSNYVLLNAPAKQDFVLFQNYPNPAKTSTQLAYQINTDAFVLIELFGVNGNKITTLVNEQKEAGTYSFMLNIEKYKLATGNYYYKMLIADKSGNTLYTNTKTIIVQ